MLAILKCQSEDVKSSRRSKRDGGKGEPHLLSSRSESITAHHVSGSWRVDSTDLLRGTVMILMALDYTQDFFSAAGMNPRDVTGPALFLASRGGATRWSVLTHAAVC